MHEFGFAQHLTCFIHVRRTIKDKLYECAIPPELTATILREIFGQRLGFVFQEDLVDSSNTEDYDNKLQYNNILWSSPGEIQRCQAHRILTNLLIGL